MTKSLQKSITPKETSIKLIRRDPSSLYPTYWPLHHSFSLTQLRTYILGPFRITRSHGHIKPLSFPKELEVKLRILSKLPLNIVFHQETSLKTSMAIILQILALPLLPRPAPCALAQPCRQGYPMDILLLTPLHIVTREQLRNPTSLAPTQQGPP